MGSSSVLYQAPFTMTLGWQWNRHADAEPAPSEGRGSASTSFPAVISKDVDGGPPPAMTITTNRRVNEFAA